MQYRVRYLTIRKCRWSEHSRTPVDLECGRSRARVRARKGRMAICSACSSLAQRCLQLRMQVLTFASIDRT